MNTEMLVSYLIATVMILSVLTYMWKVLFSFEEAPTKLTKKLLQENHALVGIALFILLGCLIWIFNFIPVNLTLFEKFFFSFIFSLVIIFGVFVILKMRELKKFKK